MELLKLVIVDDEPILLQGLLDTYDWESMGFEVVGSAKSGVQALEVIRREQPHVVLTDIRMKQMTGLMVSCCGIFWNQELFNKAGIDSFPTTWDEFWACCDKLTNAGITPLALHTDGTGWAPMLLASAAVASSSEEGAEFMSLIYPDTYQNASGLELANTLKRLFSYTTSNALYNDFDTAYNNFFTGKAAMVPNGYWMIDQIPNGWEQRVRFSSFPGNTLVSSPETFGWALTSGCSEEVKEGALAFFKFRTEFNLLEKETMLSMEEKYISQVERDYRNAFSDSPTFVPNYQVKWNSVFQENTLSKYLPQLAEGRITPEDFLNYADDSIRQFEEEQ